jgi:transcriptional regulator with XRE-family HTH domain
MSAHSLTQALGRILRIERGQAGETPEQFARRFGLATEAYAQIEAGDSTVRLSTLEQLARGLGCSVSELLRQAER